MLEKNPESPPEYHISEQRRNAGIMTGSAEQMGEVNEFREYADRLNEKEIPWSEGEYREDGKYVPGRVGEIDPEKAEFDPELKALRKELDCWTLQSEERSCAVACQTMVLNETSDRNYTEQELIALGKEKGWYTPGGTTAGNVGKIAESMGMDMQKATYGNASELAMANDPETKVLLNVDSTILHYPECEKTCRPNHVVQVLRVEDTENGKMVILNDPTDGKGLVYPIEVIQKASEGDMTILRKKA